jgi:hypothetical protein
MLRALEHLEAPATANPELTVYMWDDASTQTRMPPPPWDWSVVRLRRGEIRGYNTERIFTAYDEGASVLDVYDRDTQTALYWTRDAAELPTYELSAPLRTILHWFMSSQGKQLVHGGAVGTAGGGVLLGGKGGSGKSTSVLACLDSDLFYAADDYCLVEPDPFPFVYSIYSSAKVNAASMARLPHLVPAIPIPESQPQEKAVFFLAEQWQRKLIRGFPIVAILLPRLKGGRDTAIVPASPEESIRALGLSTIIQLPRADALTTQRIQHLVNQLPSFTLELGTDLTQIPQRINELITRVLAEPPASHMS